MSWWSFLEKHPSSAVSQLPDVAEVAREEWDRLRQKCGLNDVVLDVRYDSNYFLNRRGILATASRTMFLIEGEWQSGAINQHHAIGSIVIKVNPHVPNGWYVDDGTCATGYRYDLRSVMRHELIHGAGISSSIRQNDAGYVYKNNCYISTFDKHIENNKGEKFLNGCALSVSRASDAYVSDVKLYNPADFKLGSSFSHTDAEGVMHYSIPPMQCLDYDTSVYAMLSELGADCGSLGVTNRPYDEPTLGVTSGAVAQHTNFFVYIVTVMLIKCLLSRLR